MKSRRTHHKLGFVHYRFTYLNSSSLNFQVNLKIVVSKGKYNLIFGKQFFK
jgi:hypothetical protein